MYEGPFMISAIAIGSSRSPSSIRSARSCAVGLNWPTPGDTASAARNPPIATPGIGSVPGWWRRTTSIPDVLSEAPSAARSPSRLEVVRLPWTMIPTPTRISAEAPHVSGLILSPRKIALKTAANIGDAARITSVFATAVCVIEVTKRIPLTALKQAAATPTCPIDRNRCTVRPR